MSTTKTPFYLLSSKISNLRHRMICKGFDPTEVWLGPKEAKIIEDWFKNEEKMNRIRYTEKMMVEGKPGIEHAIFMGLTIRLMVSDGVRVGTTITHL
jgi:hypothetical protein